MWLIPTTMSKHTDQSSYAPWYVLPILIVTVIATLYFLKWLSNRKN